MSRGADCTSLVLVLVRATTEHRLMVFPSLRLIPSNRVQVQGPHAQQTQLVPCSKRRSEKYKVCRRCQDLPLPKSLSVVRRTLVIQTPPPPNREKQNCRNAIRKPPNPNENQESQPTQSWASSQGGGEVHPGLSSARIAPTLREPV